MRRAALTLVAVAVSTTLFAQSAPYIESFDVRVNNVDVIVTDRAGNRVTGLRQEDFVVKEGGVVQQVTNFSEYRAESGVAGSVPSSVSRKFVFLIDTMSLHPERRVVLKAAIQNLVANGMRDGDEAMIVRPSSPDRIPQPFTADRAVLAARLDSIIDQEYFRAETPINLARNERAQASESLSIAGANGVYFTNEYERMHATFGYIQSIVSAMAEVPGKKTMVLVTESLPSFSEIAGSRMKLDHSNFKFAKYSTSELVDQIARIASTNGIAIYTLQPQWDLGLAIDGPDVGRRTGRATFQHQLGGSEATMHTFAEHTGAAWSREIGKFFTTLQDDLSTYYSLGYRPTTAADNKPRRIVVAVKGRPELRVRTRQDVVGKTLAEEMNERVVGHLVYPNTVDELGVRTVVGEPRRSNTKTVVELTVAVPIASLTLLPEGGKYRGSFRVHYAAAGEGTFSSGVERVQVVEIAAADIDNARTHDFQYTTNIEVPNDRRTDIAVGVLDPLSRLTSFKTLTVDAR